MRPDSIKKFDLFYLGSIALGAINVLINRGAMAEQFKNELARQGDETGQMLSGSEGAVVIGGVILGTLISLLLWFLVSRQKISLVRWIIAALTAYSLLSLPALIGALPSLMAMVSLLGIILQIVAVYYVFQTESTVWLRGKKIVDDSDTHPDPE